MSTEVRLTALGNNNGIKFRPEKSAFYSTILPSLAAGSMAGALAKTAIAPLDRTKINFQVSRTRRYSFLAALRFVRSTYRSTGFFSLFRGNSATMARVVPFAAIQFASRERYKQIFDVDQGGNRTPFKRAMVGSLAAMTATTLTYPLDTAKARLSVSSKEEYRNLRSVLKKEWTEYGLTTFYRGIIPTLLGAMVYAGASFFTFDTLKLFYKDNAGKDSNPFLSFLFGAAAGVVGQSSSYPLDIVRRRMQTGRIPTHHGTMRVLYTVWLNEGLVNGLYKGLSMNWVKGPMAAGICFATYDHTYAFLRSILLRLAS